MVARVVASADPGPARAKPIGTAKATSEFKTLFTNCECKRILCERRHAKLS
jgi:hypothetical protein